MSSYPGNKIPQAPFFGFDKVIHIGMYFVLSITIIFGFSFPQKVKKVTFKLASNVVLFGIFFGGVMEICQHYIFINRSGNWYDFFANSIGAILGVLIYPIMVKWLPFKS